MLVLTDVSGTWEATYVGKGVPARRFVMTLRQSGTRVTGATSAEGSPSTRSILDASLEGVVNGEVFTFTLRSGAQGEVHLGGEDMSGSMMAPQVSAFVGCPCP